MFAQYYSYIGYMIQSADFSVRLYIGTKDKGTCAPGYRG